MALIYEKKDRIAYITLNRPDVLNAFDIEQRRELSEALIDYRDDDRLLVAIITGAGRAFCAGADIEKMLPVRSEKELDKPWFTPPTPMRGLQVWKPLIAAVNGAALGAGLELALSCDLRIAAEGAVFGAVEVTLGIIPGWGATQRLPRLIPMTIAAEMLLTGLPIDAREAYRIGLVNRVVSPATLMQVADEIAENLLRASPLAVRAAKEAMIRGTSLSLDEGLRLEQDLEKRLYRTEDFQEGIRAFKERRKPEFKAR